MRILHAASDIAGVPSVLARHQRALGHEARNASYVPHAFGFPSDWSYTRWNSASRLRKLSVAVGVTLRMLPRYDVFHLTGERSLLPGMLDLPLLKRLGKTVVVHFHGCDVRQVERVIGGPMVHCHQCQLRPVCAAGPQLRRRQMALRYADVVICSTPDLQKAVPRSVHVPNPIDLDDWKVPTVTSRRDGRRGFVVAHVPSDPRLKGTDFVIAAANALRAEGYPIELRIKTGIDHNDVRRLYESADLVVDQLLFGWYGLVAIEAMAMGKPVLVYLRADVQQRYPDPPILKANPASIKQVLASAVQQREALVEIGLRGRAYVEQVHDARRVASDIVDLYRAAGARG